MSKTISGLLIIILGFVLEDKSIIQPFVNDLMTISGVALSWYARYQNGDINLVGFRKK